MSGVYIPTIEMPKSCGDCKFCLIRSGDSLCESDMFCFLTEKELCLYKNRESINNIKIGDCPLKEVPTHGRLIDASAEIKRIKKMQEELPNTEKRDKIYYKYDEIVDYLYDSPTVLEASTESTKERE